MVRQQIKNHNHHLGEGSSLIYLAPHLVGQSPQSVQNFPNLFLTFVNQANSEDFILVTPEGNGEVVHLGIVTVTLSAPIIQKKVNQNKVVARKSIRWLIFLLAFLGLAVVVAMR